MNRKNAPIFPLLLVIYEITIYLSMDAYIPALPKIAKIFHTSNSLAQLTVSIWMAGGLLLQIFIGPLADRYGRRPILLSGGVLYVISTLVCAISPNIHFMLIARFIQGIAMPSMFIAGYAAINEWFSSQESIKILARMNSVTILAPAFGPLLGGAFLLFFDWRWIFVVIAALSFICVVLLFYKMPETIPKEQKSSQLKLSTIISQYFSILKNRPFMFSSIITFFPTTGLISWMIAGPFIVINLFHYSTLDFGLFQGLIFGCFMLGTKIVNKYTSPKHNNFLVNLGLGLNLLSASLATLIAWYYPNQLFTVIFFIMLISFGSALSMSILNRLTLETSDAPMGVRLTVFSFIRIASGITGAICVTFFYNGSLLSLALILLVFIFIPVACRLLNLDKKT